MAFTQLPSFTQTVSMLPDNPALTPSALKSQFDAAPTELLTYFNNLITALKQTTSGDSGAKNIGVTSISGLTGNDVQTLLGALATQLAVQPEGALILTPTGAGSGYPLDTAGSLTPSKKLSQCRNGWKLVWQHYTSPSADDWGYQYTYINKQDVTATGGGKASWFPLVSTESSSAAPVFCVKILYISDDHFTGHADNNKNNAGNIVLKGIYEW